MGVGSTWTDPNSLDLTTNQVLTQTIWENLLGNLLWLFGTTGATVTFTPTLSQSGALTLSTATGRYIKVGKWVIATVHIVVNSSGTGGNDIILGALPVAANSTSAGPIFGLYQRTGANPKYTIAGVFATTTTVTLYGGNGTSALGTNPSFAAVASDILDATLIYEGA